MEWDQRTACIAVKADHTVPVKIWEQFQGWKHALGAWELTGEWDFLFWLDVKDWDELHEWVMELRSWEGVRYTSSHLIYGGFKEGTWWWNDPHGVWLWARCEKVGKWREPVKLGWAVSGFTMPGDWDNLFWVQGRDWTEVWERTRQLRASGWETLTQVPMRSWWNKARLEGWK